MFPCNCRPPFPRPEPFSPLPRPGHVPDWGKWIRDRLAEKGALLAFPTRTAFPSAGSAPNLYLAEDTGVVYRWGGEGYAVLVDPSSDVETHPGRSAFPDTGRTGVIYVDASANLIYRWDGTGYVLLTSDLSGVESRLADVESKVPAQATAQNQLADKAFVNSSIATNTAFYISDNGRPFRSLADLENYEGALTNNDYAFVVGRDAAGNTTYTRYKWNASTEEWAEEYVLNNSSFTAEQWAAISSGITSGLVAKLGALPTAEALAQALAGKQDKLTFETSVARNSDNPVKSSGIWSAIWGALSALPAGFSSLYDWCVDQLAGKASKADATLTPIYSDTPTFSEWTVAATNPAFLGPYTVEWNTNNYRWEFYSGAGALLGTVKDRSPDTVAVTLTQGTSIYTATRTRTDFLGYQLGSQTDKPLASETEAAANRAAISTLNDTKADKSGLDPLLFSQYYPEGNVKSAAEFTAGIKYDAPDTTNRTITVKPFCKTGDSEDDNSGLVGRVVIPPFVDASGNGYISDDGTRFKVVGVSGRSSGTITTNLTTIVAPNTVTTIGDKAFRDCTALVTVSLPAATTIGNMAFYGCTALVTVSLPAAANIRPDAFYGCIALVTVSLPAATTIETDAFTSCTKLTSVLLPVATVIRFAVFYNCASLTSVDFGDTPRSSVPFLGNNAFNGVPTTCKIIVPDAQYDAWVAASGWSDLVTAGYKFLRHSEWEYARKYEVDKKADKPATFATGNLAALDANGNPTDSGITNENVALKSAIPYDLGTPTIINSASSEVVGGETVNYGAATLADRTANVVQVTTPLDELRITFPAATSGKVRDFGLRVEIGTGSAALTAPALVPIAPTGETIKIENNAKEIPALADGTATAKGVTLLYFSENAPGVFVVKGEQVEEVA